MLQIGAEAVKSATEGVKEGVAQVKESVAPFVESDQVPFSIFPHAKCESSLLKKKA